MPCNSYSNSSSGSYNNNDSNATWTPKTSTKHTENISHSSKEHNLTCCESNAHITNQPKGRQKSFICCCCCCSFWVSFSIIFLVIWWSSTVITVIGQWLHQSNLLEPIGNAIGDVYFYLFLFFCFFFFFLSLWNKWIHFWSHSKESTIKKEFHVKWLRSISFHERAEKNASKLWTTENWMQRFSNQKNQWNQ